MDKEIKETMQFKAKQIKKFADAKEKSMAIMSSGRDATLIVTERMKSAPDWSKADIEHELTSWRNWFWVNIYTRDPDDDLEQEAKERGEVDPF